MSDVDGSTRPIPPGESRHLDSAEPAEPGTAGPAARPQRFWNSGTWWWSALVLVIAQTTAMRVEGIPNLGSPFDLTALLLDALVFAVPLLLVGVVVRSIALGQRRRTGSEVQPLSADQRLYGAAALAVLLVAPTASASLVQLTRGDRPSESANEAAIASCDHAWFHLSALHDEMAAGTADPDVFRTAANEMVQAREMVLASDETALVDVLADLAMDINSLAASLQAGDSAALSQAAMSATLSQSELEALCDQAYEDGY